MMIKHVFQRIMLALAISALLLVSAIAAVSAQSTQGTATPINPCVTAPTGTQGATQSVAQGANPPPHVGVGPDDAGQPLDCWVSLNGRQWHWYKFRYGYNARTDNPPHQADIALTMNNAGCISFELWTPERLKAAKDDHSLGPVGTGTPKFTPVDPKSSSSKNQIPTILTWSGSQAGSSTFYVIVKNRTDATCTYQLSISGYSVFYPKTGK